MLGSFAGCLIFGALYSIASLLYKYFEFRWCSYLAVIGVILHTISFDLGVGPIGWYFAQEITPQSCRSLAAGISSFFYWMVVYATGVGFYPLFELLDSWAFLILFTCPLLVGLTILWKLMPESKGKTTSEILQTMGYTKLETERTIKGPVALVEENVVFKF